MDVPYPLQLFVWQANAVLDSDFVSHAALLTQDCNALDLNTILNDACGMAVDWRRGTLNTSPSTDSATPSNDGVQNASIVFHLGVF